MIVAAKPMPAITGPTCDLDAILNLASEIARIGIHFTGEPISSSIGAWNRRASLRLQKRLPKNSA